MWPFWPPFEVHSQFATVTVHVRLACDEPTSLVGESSQFGSPTGSIPTTHQLGLMPEPTNRSTRLTSLIVVPLTKDMFVNFFVPT